MANDRVGGDDRLKCSFCGKPTTRVKKLVGSGVHLERPGPQQSPIMAYICDECIELCVEILEDEGIAEHRWSIGDLLTKLDQYEAESQRETTASEARTYADAATRFVRWMNREKALPIGHHDPRSGGEDH